MKFEFAIPIHAISANNQREHWAVKAERARTQRAAAYRKTKSSTKGQVQPVLAITLVRVAARRLDDDNLRGSLKSVRDGIATALGFDDRTPLITWRYDQQTGDSSIIVTVEAA